MKRRSRDVVAGLLFLGMLVVAVVLALVAPLIPVQRIAALTIIGVAVLWTAALLWALSRGSEGLDRLGGSPPLVLDLLAPTVMLAAAFFIGGVAPEGVSGGLSVAGVAAGSMLMVPFSLTLRWLWWERQRCRSVGRPARDQPTTAPHDSADSRRTGVTGPPVPPRA